MGNAEDYLRVASNVSTLLEIVLGAARGVDVSRVFTFGSATMPFLAVALTHPGQVVRVYVVRGGALGCDWVVCGGGGGGGVWLCVCVCWVGCLLLGPEACLCDVHVYV